MQVLLNQIHQAKVINPDNLMAKHFDQAYFNSLPKDLQTRLLQICKSGAENPDRYVLKATAFLGDGQPSHSLTTNIFIQK